MALSPPPTLSPSKLSRFVQCPLAFRYSYIDHLPEPPTVPQVRGTLVHRALELLYSNAKADERTPARAVQALEEAWSKRGDFDEFLSLGLDSNREERLLAEARELVSHYLDLEDPSGVNDIGVELSLRANVDGVELVGIIDRLDELPDGSLAVVDYKTGSSPIEVRTKASFGGVAFYAVLCEEVLDRRPQEVRLMYLRDQVVLVQAVTDQQVRGTRLRALAVWSAIERACEREDFRPNPSPLCRTCAFRPLCPAFADSPANSVPRTA